MLGAPCLNRACLKRKNPGFGVPGFAAQGWWVLSDIVWVEYRILKFAYQNIPQKQKKSTRFESLNSFS